MATGSFESEGDDDLQVTTAVPWESDNKSPRVLAEAITHIIEDGGIIQGIGIASAQPKTRPKRVLASHAKSSKDFCSNWLVLLYHTDRASHAREVRRAAIRHIEKRGEQKPGSHGNANERGSEKRHYVYAIVHRSVEYIKNYYRGNPILKVDNYLEEENDPPFYIGMASGPNELTAMKRRRIGDKYKECHGINVMVAIFHSRSQDKCREVEKEIVKSYRDDDNILNRTGGGGGRPSSQPCSVVYLGMRVEKIKTT